MANNGIFDTSSNTRKPALEYQSSGVSLNQTSKQMAAAKDNIEVMKESESRLSLINLIEGTEEEETRKSN